MEAQAANILKKLCKNYSKMSSCMERNPGRDLDISWVRKSCVNLPAVNRRAETLKTRRSIKKQWQAAWLLRGVSCLDLTTLSGDDTSGNVARLCFKAQSPVRKDLLKSMGFDKEITVGAVCVYSTRVPDAVKSLKDAGSNIPVASVAAGFPAGRWGNSVQVIVSLRACVCGGRFTLGVGLPYQRDRVTLAEGQCFCLHKPCKCIR